MLRSGGGGAWGARHYVAPQVRVTERDASKVSLSAEHAFLREKCAAFVMQDVLAGCHDFVAESACVHQAVR